MKLHDRKPKTRHTIESTALQSSRYDDNIKGNNEPLHDKKNPLFHGVGLMKATFLNCKKKVFQIISGVSNSISHIQIFQDYNILTLPSLYITEVKRRAR
jgi:hypothetical protein